MGSQEEEGSIERLQSTLAAREATLESILQGTTFGIGVVRDRVLVEVNDAVCRMVGRSREELVGQSSRLLYASDEDFERVGREKYAQIAEAGAGQVETRWQRVDGRIIDVLLSSAPYESPSSGGLVAFSALDITRRKRRERWMRLESEVLQLLATGLDLRETLRAVVPRIRVAAQTEVVGIRLRDGDSYPYFEAQGFAERIEESGGLCLDDTAAELDPEGHPRLRCVCGAVLGASDNPDRALLEPSGSFASADIGDLPEAEARRCTRRGYRSLALVPLRCDGAVIGLLQLSDPQPGLIDDELLSLLEGLAAGIGAAIARLRDREALRQAQKLEAVGALASGIAHDLNNMLAPVLGHAELLLETLPGASAMRTDLETICAMTERARRLTRQLLAFGRRQRLDLRALELDQVVREMEPMLRGMLSEKVTLAFSHRDGDKPIVADAAQLEQVLLHLAVNAQDAMPSGGSLKVATDVVELHATTLFDNGTQLPPGRYAELRVSDTGVGIAPALARQIFDPFVTTKDVGQGSGLGLSLIFGIVQQHGGALRLDSKIDRGTTFSVLLPLASGDAEAAAELRKKGRHGRILVVEDDPYVRRLAVRVLQRAGYGVYSAADAETALAGFREGRFGEVELLLADVVLPETSGAELFEQARQLLPNLHVLYMSGYPDHLLRRYGVHFRAAVLRKPFTVEAITRMVELAFNER